MSRPELDFMAVWQEQVGDQPVGHSHFWERALSRRQLVTRGAGLAGVAMSSAFAWPGAGLAASRGPVGMPRPIPGGTMIDGLGLFHFYFPTSPNPAGATDVIQNGRGDNSTITDFNGFLGVGEFGGGTGKDQRGQTLYWAADVRFMDGEYVDLNGRHQQGAFAFV
jgi:hypothetical protein